MKCEKCVCVCMYVNGNLKIINLTKSYLHICVFVLYKIQEYQDSL